MTKLFDIIYAGRKKFTELVDSLSVEQLNEIPEGFNNNIAWNFGHIVVSQQMLCYVRPGFTAHMDDHLIKKYQKGTKPESFILQSEIAVLKTYAFSLVDQLKEDLNNDKFKGYTTFATQFGVELTSIRDAIPYFATHDTLHLGYAMAIAKHLSITKQFSNFQHIKFSN
ncbi:DinB family protein [Terrimonas sp.]|uniref:DinB family protein n=1 Tax=Terrimonas sp. TaxID=1914338 RepID=UPI00197F73A4|nr:DinB family protein [Terrimonas sp.]